jgi:hypothetical protein
MKRLDERDRLEEEQEERQDDNGGKKRKSYSNHTSQTSIGKKQKNGDSDLNSN